MNRIIRGIRYADEYDPSLEYEAMRVCRYFSGNCDAPCCPLDPNLFAGRHWYPEYDDVCKNRLHWQHPMVRAQRRIAKRPKPIHLGLEWGMTVKELVHLGTKKRKASAQSMEAIEKFRYKKQHE